MMQLCGNTLPNRIIWWNWNGENEVICVFFKRNDSLTGDSLNKMALTASDMCAYEHILYCVPLFYPFLLSAGIQKNMFFNMFINQRVTKKFSYSM